MTWLAVMFALELGLAPEVNLLQYDPKEYLAHEWEICYVDLSVEMEFWRIFFVGGGVRTYVVLDTLSSWIPNTTVYDWCIGARWKLFEIGLRKRCFHPTVPFLPLFQQEITGLEGFYDELYLRLEVKVGEKKTH